MTGGGGYLGAGGYQEFQCEDSQHIFRSDNEAPPHPDRAGGHQGKVLCDGELLGGSDEIRCASDDDAPFHDWCPLDANEISAIAIQRELDRLEQMQQRYVAQFE
jgi:hypothetical protein